ncbi:unnamed protein product [Cyclocybe aegerita]|uniref:Polynucleotide 5'-hydroxyl-kinase GRC3 n=1 Tax=Cyclocybe aegerita TaxID=1973307 RepID=A0A8S0XQI6_CYCAE|nr:unnamed protein product [Cyclocybe aegerita]
MISAVAARKAALAAKTQSEPQLPIPESITPPPPQPPLPNGSQKRKSTAQKQKPQKKARKLKPFEKSNGPRPTEHVVDVFKDQTDVIVLQSDSDDESDDAMSVLGESDKEPVVAAEKRTWSPSAPMDVSSDEESLDENVTGLDTSTLFPHPRRSRQTEEIVSASTFRPALDRNMFYLTEQEAPDMGMGEKGTLLCLNAEDSLCLLGACHLTVLHGSIHLFGATLRPSPRQYPIYAPRSSLLPVLTASGDSSSGLKVEKLPPRLQRLAQFPAVIFLQELNTGVEGLGLICRTFEGVFEPSRWYDGKKSQFNIAGLHMVTQITKDVSSFTIPGSWSAALDGISTRNGMYIVKGPKNSGKSTFARTLTNRLLQSYSRVAFLECDIGQSEFTPGGLVSLNIISEPILGPPFTHPTLPNHAHFIGSTTPRSTPSHYLNAISALIQTYRLDIQNPAIDIDADDERISDAIPLVVNTMGWSKGLGADLTQKIESFLEPTDVFDIRIPDSEPLATNSYAAFNSSSMTDGSNARVHVLEPTTTPPITAFTSADQRTMSTLSYFHARFPLDAVPTEYGQLTASSWDTSRPLCAVPPYEIDCGVAFDKVILSGAGTEDVVEEEIGRVLNGAIVGLVKCDPGTLDVEPPAPNPVGIPYSRQTEPPDPSTSTCVGLALVRGISSPSDDATDTGNTKTYLQLLTPLPHALLAGSRVLVKGEMELPVWGMLDFREEEEGDVAGVEKENVPYLQWGKAPDGAMGAERRKVRRNLMRRGQM